MLNELETLSRNIGQLIEINQRFHELCVTLNAQLSSSRTQCDVTRTELEHTRGERDTLRTERDALAAKITDAQVRLNAILEKLPHAKNEAQPEERQLELIETAPPAPLSRPAPPAHDMHAGQDAPAAPPPPDSHAPPHGENA